MLGRLARPRETAAALVGLAAAGAVAALPGSAGPAALGLVAVATGAVVAWIAWQDAIDLTIPDGAVIALAALGVGLRLADGSAAGEPLAGTLGTLALDAVLSGGGLLALREYYFRRHGQDGIGFGDVKLAAAGGLLVGTIAFAWALLAASLAGIALVLARKGRAPLSGSEKLAFGAVLAPAIWIAWAAEQMPGLGPLLR